MLRILNFIFGVKIIFEMEINCKTNEHKMKVSLTLMVKAEEFSKKK